MIERGFYIYFFKGIETTKIGRGYALQKYSSAVCRKKHCIKYYFTWIMLTKVTLNQNTSVFYAIMASPIYALSIET